MLVPPLYMLQVYDRVITTRSEATLLMLTLIMVFLFVVMGGLEIVRSRLLVRAGNRLDTLVSEQLYTAMFRRGLSAAGRQSAQPLNDLSSLRQFLAGNGLFAFFDVPWIPIYIGVLFLFNVWFGVFAIGAASVLLIMAIANEYATRGLLAQANGDHIQAQALANANLRNAEVLHAMGMLPGIRRRWAAHHQAFLLKQSWASDRAGTFSNVSKVLRLLFQSLILGLGALLVLDGAISPGMMIAGSILMGRALAPIDQMINAWKGFVAARSAHQRLQALLSETPADAERMSLPVPQGKVDVQHLTVGPPGARTPTLSGIDFDVEPGEHIGVVGPSASGKSSLARALLGLWQPLAGKVRLDGADITQWNRDELGPHIGYLPQDIELFEGTIGENIARFGEVDSVQVVEAARRAGVHEMILQQPEGYDTVIADASGSLSGGQRQRIGLARALYGQPRLVILDEPNSNLDDSGERALGEAIERLKRDNVTLFIISHRTGILRRVDRLLVLKEGKVAAFGPSRELLGKLAGPPRTAASDKPSNHGASMPSRPAIKGARWGE